MLNTISHLINNRLRPPMGSKAWFKVWAKRVYNLPGLVAILWQTSRWQMKGVQLGVLASIGKCTIKGNQSLLSIGSYSYIGRATIHLRKTVTIGKSVIINDGAVLLTGSHEINDPRFQVIGKPIVIEDYAWICTGAYILPGVTIGRGAVVGAGAVVARDVPAYHVMVGNPARATRTDRNPNLDYKPNLLRACFEAWVGVPYADSSQ